MAGAAGLEPATLGFGDRCSTKLSYAPAPCTYNFNAFGRLGQCENAKEACKPSSVPGAWARRAATIYLAATLPSWSCGQPRESPGVRNPLFGLAPDGVCLCLRCYHQSGALLPRLFTLTSTCCRGGLFSVALSVGSPRPAVSGHPARWSSDFPLSRAWRNSGRPASLVGYIVSPADATCW